MHKHINHKGICNQPGKIKLLRILSRIYPQRECVKSPHFTWSIFNFIWNPVQISWWQTTKNLEKNSLNDLFFHPFIRFSGHEITGKGDIFQTIKKKPSPDMSLILTIQRVAIIYTYSIWYNSSDLHFLTSKWSQEKKKKGPWNATAIIFIKQS